MYEKFLRLCEKEGVTPYKVSKETGVAQSTLSDWKTGKSEPKIEKLQKIANYFGVSVNYFYNEEENNEAYYLDNETKEIAQQIFENKDLRLLFDAARGCKPEDIQTVHTMLLALKKKEGGIIE